MGRNKLAITRITTVLLLLNAVLFFCTPAQVKDNKNIPEELRAIGFNEEIFVDYVAEDNFEYFTFFDWRTQEPWDTITFVVEEGKAKGWFKDIDGEVVYGEM
jgi:hypothetical protein